MGDDLGAAMSEVHAAARAVLAFWFDEAPADKHFAKDEALGRRSTPAEQAWLNQPGAGW